MIERGPGWRGDNPGDEDLREVKLVALDDPLRLPTDEDLPSEDGVPLETIRHAVQMRDYLISPLVDYFERVGFKAFVGGNNFVYYDVGLPGVGPDVFVVNGGEPHSHRRSWVAWQEAGLLPTLVIELTSASTKREDRGRKFVLYRDRFRAPDYYLFDVWTGRFDGFHLEKGMYVPVKPDALGRMHCVSLDLSLGVVDGWLRWFDPGGAMIRTGSERARQEAEHAAREEERAAHEAERAAREAERAAREAERAERETERAELETERAERAEAEVRQLQEELRRLRGQR